MAGRDQQAGGQQGAGRTIRRAIYAPATRAPEGRTIPSIRASLPLTTTFRRCLAKRSRRRSLTSLRCWSPSRSEAVAAYSCFHPNHSLTLARMDVAAIAAVVDAWASETATMGELPYIDHVQIFENRGAMMGCQQSPSALPDLGDRHVPDEPLRELAAQQEYSDSTNPACCATMLRRSWSRLSVLWPRTTTSSRLFRTGLHGPLRR